ncbi:type II toxin-antitoxin system VapC family toxin [Brevundimonas sp.]|uniref:type II toxin-antitoxin system VapC family toxin n=1 Tax=Brevundimonas sp. TaxID=1871086 RepID=UPI001A1826EE|nr:type II toxin-antitoxin system VapC family toxin [Brevundimonas sp.]MBJ7484376.1 type II toxin-antitoxin system VapC family toxin [Brevundimonas sp.]
MIVVDASALVAILLNESEGPAFREALLVESDIRLSPVGYWEAAIRLRSLRGVAGVKDLDRLIAQFNIAVSPATAATAVLASEAESLYGKRSAAKLNLGDCFAYALAKELDAPLLFKGGDFTETDLISAVPA